MTDKTDGRTDRRTDGQHEIYMFPPEGGRHNDAREAELGSFDGGEGGQFDGIDFVVIYIFDAACMFSWNNAMAHLTRV